MSSAPIKSGSHGVTNGVTYFSHGFKRAGFTGVEFYPDRSQRSCIVAAQKPK